MTIYHKHHIIPKHAGGSDDPSNLVRLTVEEHAEVHRKLFEEHGREQDRIAWMGLSSQITKQEAIRQSLSLGGRMNRGRTLSDDHKEKISRFRIGKPLSEGAKSKLTNREITSQSRKKMSESAKIRKHSQETKSKMSVSLSSLVWVTDPKTKQNRRIRNSQPTPEGWVRGRS